MSRSHRPLLALVCLVGMLLATTPSPGGAVRSATTPAWSWSRNDPGPSSPLLGSSAAIVADEVEREDDVESAALSTGPVRDSPSPARFPALGRTTRPASRAIPRLLTPRLRQ